MARLPVSWMSDKLEVRMSRIHAKGVFTKESIRKGERLTVFGGDVMLIDEIVCLPAGLNEYPMQIEERFVLGSRSARDPEPSDFINHSCEPNCGFKGQIFLVAMRDIEPDEEITFDYAMVVSKSVGSNIVFEMECNCGEPTCRKLISEDDWRLTELQSKYSGFFSQYLQERIDGSSRNMET